MAKKNKNLQLTEKDLLWQFWLELPTQFYERVKGAALEMGISQKQLVSRAVDDFIEEISRPYSFYDCEYDPV